MSLGLYLYPITFPFCSTLLSLGPWPHSFLKQMATSGKSWKIDGTASSHLHCHHSTQSPPPPPHNHASLSSPTQMGLSSHTLTPAGKVGLHDEQGELPKGKNNGKQKWTICPLPQARFGQPSRERGSSLRLFVPSSAVALHHCPALALSLLVSHTPHEPLFPLATWKLGAHPVSCPWRSAQLTLPSEFPLLPPPCPVSLPLSK